MPMESLDDVKSAIRLLTADDRRALQSWLATTLSYDTDALGFHIAEPSLAYGALAEIQLLSAEEYLKFEANSEHRHEYIDGAIYAMSGASEHHELIAGNLFAAIHGHLRGGPCRAYIENFKLRLRLDARDLFYYPDIMVSCDREGIASHYLYHPKLIMEVLSPSTESIDRREKFLSYKQIAAMEEYALVSQDSSQITLYRRSENWAPRVHSGLGSAITLQSVGLSLTLAQAYEGVPKAEKVQG